MNTKPDIQYLVVLSRYHSIHTGYHTVSAGKLVIRTKKSQYLFLFLFTSLQNKVSYQRNVTKKRRLLRERFTCLAKRRSGFFTQCYKAPVDLCLYHHRRLAFRRATDRWSGFTHCVSSGFCCCQFFHLNDVCFLEFS